MSSYYFVPIEFLSPEYDLAIKLRDTLLRKPLNLEFTVDNLEDEYMEFHFGVFNNYQALIACLSFKPLSDDTLKMRQVAVDKDIQGRGVGKFLVQQSELWAKSNNYKTIELNARDTAVSFYEKLIYQKHGEVFYELNIPHWSMHKLISK